MANSVDPEGAVWSGSAMFALTCMSEYMYSGLLQKLVCLIFSVDEDSGSDVGWDDDDFDVSFQPMFMLFLLSCSFPN